jgi:hypothetical protein
MTPSQRRYKYFDQVLIDQASSSQSKLRNKFKALLKSHWALPDSDPPNNIVMKNFSSLSRSLSKKKLSLFPFSSKSFSSVEHLSK